jgi:hypothetical protein
MRKILHILGMHFTCFCTCAGCLTGKGHCHSVTCGS